MSNKLKTPVYVISDMTATLTPGNVEVINEKTELHFDDINNVTYQNLIDARRESRGSEYGYPKYKNGVKFWVLTSIPMGLVVEPNSTAITEYTEQEYINDVLPLWDIEEIEF